MAKGFTVKTKTPVKKTAEWDYDKAKEMVRGKAIVFCLPGRGCSYAYLKNFVQLCFDSMFLSPFKPTFDRTAIRLLIPQ